MSARKKLNGLYLIGCGVLAAFIGLVFGSWWVFGVTLALSTAAQIVSGNIRLVPGQRY